MAKEKKVGWFKGLILKWVKEFYEGTQIRLSPHDSDNEIFMYDFRKGWLSGSSNGNGFPIGQIVQGEGSAKVVEQMKIAIKPIDVLEELERAPMSYELANIDDKIELLKIKRDFISQRYAKRDIEALLERLENRKKYFKYASFFTPFQNTTDFAIGKILEKYKLVMELSDLFMPTFPKEAVDIMVKYTKKFQLVCKKKPIFYVIAEEKDFKKKDERLDPILLAQSPFGFYYQILGAWDKEMLILSEL